MKALCFSFLSLCLGASILVGCGGGSNSGSGGGGGTTPPALTVSSISPTTAPAGSSSLTLTVVGTGFITTSAVEVGGAAESTAYVSGTELTAVVPAAQMASGGQLAVMVKNGSVDSGSGAAIKLEVDNPSPTISAVSPSVVEVGTASPVVTITGSGFVPTTAIYVNGSARATTFLSSTQVSAVLVAADVSAGATLSLTAVNPKPNGGTSTAVTVMVVVPNPVPTISSLNPAAITVACGSPAISVTGTGFVAATVVEVNGSPRATSFSSASLVSVTLTSSDVSATGTLSLTAVNPAPGGGSSAAVSLPVNNPPIGPLQFSPTALLVGATSPTTVTVTGSTFVPASVIQVNKQPRTTAYMSPNTLTFTATVADQSVLGTLLVTVINPAPGGGTSPVGYLPVSGLTPTPAIISVSPSTIYTDSPDTPITVVGTGFTMNSTIEWNGTAISTGFGYSYPGGSLYATIPAADFTASGTASVSVNTPTSSPSLSNAVTVTIADPPAPTLTNLYPNAGPINAAASVTLAGTGFAPRSTVAVNGVTVPSTM